MNGVKVTYRLAEAEDKNWNEEWERNGFEPVRIADRILIHSPEHHNLSPAEYDIVIDPHQAFGTGTHHTTGMILERLLGMDLGHKTVLDAGCGTGVLGIFCTLKGAKSVWAYDIDRWSVDNTKENMLLNGVKNMEVVEGNASILQGKDAFDLILANINRNILLADLPSFVSVMHAGSQMILSGFYVEEYTFACAKSEKLGAELPQPYGKRELGYAFIRTFVISDMNLGLPVMSVGLPAALFFFITNLQGRYNCLPVPVWSVSSSLQTTR